MKDELLQEYAILYSLKILKENIEEQKQDKILELYYSMEYVKKLKKRESKIKMIDKGE